MKPGNTRKMLEAAGLTELWYDLPIQDIQDMYWA